MLQELLASADPQTQSLIRASQALEAQQAAKAAKASQSIAVLTPEEQAAKASQAAHKAWATRRNNPKPGSRTPSESAKLAHQTRALKVQQAIEAGKQALQALQAIAAQRIAEQAAKAPKAASPKAASPKAPKAPKA